MPFNHFPVDLTLTHTYYNSRLANDALIVHFETLVGKEGNPDVTDKQQISLIDKIAKHCEVDLTEQDLIEIRDQLYGDTQTFRSGKIGNYKNIFTPSASRTFDARFLHLSKDLGYE